ARSGRRAPDRGSSMDRSLGRRRGRGSGRDGSAPGALGRPPAAPTPSRPRTQPWVAGAVEAAAGTGARLVRSEGLERFDILPLLVATDGAVAAFGHDRRRLRPNLVVGGVEGLAERAWEGSALRAGRVMIGIRDLRQRCIMTTFDRGSLAQDVEVLKGIHRRFGGRLALNCYVVRGGTLSVGGPVELGGPAGAGHRGGQGGGRG